VIPSEAGKHQDQQVQAEDAKKVVSTVLSDHITLRIKSDTHSASIAVR